MIKDKLCWYQKLFLSIPGYTIKNLKNALRLEIILHKENNELH
jgi:hypothetical protein